MRGAVKKKHLEKNIPPIFGKYRIKKTLDKFLEKVMKATKYKQFRPILNKVNEGDEKNKQKKTWLEKKILS